MKRTFENGVYDISNEDYHNSNGVSRSALMYLLKSPFHYHSQFIVDRPKQEPTPAMIIGELVHTLVLEPLKYMERFYVMPKLDRRTTAGKQLYHACLLEKLDRTLISEDMVEEANAIANAVRANEIATQLLAGAKMEQSIYWTHEATGIQCKARPDAWLLGSVVDLKTTLDAGFRSFQNSAYKYGYFLQAGMCYEALKSLGIKMESFVFLAVEKAYPYATGIFTLDGEALDYGINQFNELVGRLKLCVEKDYWPGFGIQNLTTPNYANYDVLLEIEE